MRLRLQDALDCLTVATEHIDAHDGVVELRVGALHSLVVHVLRVRKSIKTLGPTKKTTTSTTNEVSNTRPILRSDEAIRSTRASAYLKYELKQRVEVLRGRRGHKDVGIAVSALTASVCARTEPQHTVIKPHELPPAPKKRKQKNPREVREVDVPDCSSNRDTKRSRLSTSTSSGQRDCATERLFRNGLGERQSGLGLVDGAAKANQGANLHTHTRQGNITKSPAPKFNGMATVAVSRHDRCAVSSQPATQLSPIRCLQAMP